MDINKGNVKKLRPESLQYAIEKQMEADFMEEKIGGASVLIKQNGQVIYKNCFGNAKENSVFRLASMTKPITAVAILIQIQRGLLSLEDDISKYLPAFAEKGITIHHLLTHSSGLGSGAMGDKQFEDITEKQRESLASVVESYGTMELDFAPGTKTFYSAIAGFDVLARIVELTSQKNFQQFLYEEIFLPCRMTDTTFVPSEEQWNRMIPMHDRQDGKAVIGQTWENCVFHNFPTTYFCGGAGLASTLQDYDNFTEMLLCKGSFQGKQIVSEKWMEQMRTSQLPPAIWDNPKQWGFGVRVVTEKTRDSSLFKGSFGWSGAYGTHFFVDPYNRVVAIYMKNSKYDGGSGSVTGKRFEECVMGALN